MVGDQMKLDYPLGSFGLLNLLSGPPNEILPPLDPRA